VTWDGTGYGSDGTIWGGEFLLGNAAGYERVAHLRPFRLPGGDAAVKEPRRAALALLWELYGDSALEMDNLPPIRDLRPAERKLLAQMLAKGLNAPLTTSAGRLFDGVAALIGLHQQVSFEGQAAMALEFATDAREAGAYETGVRSQEPGVKRQMSNAVQQSAISNQQSAILDWGPLVVGALADLRRGVAQGIIAARFHNALVEAIVAVAQHVGVARVALTGGCFQNRRLTERTADRLQRAGFEALLHRQVPPNDGGISLGQVAVAAARLAHR
jgi:hydrogenase maturation protein HypF